MERSYKSPAYHKPTYIFVLWMKKSLSEFPSGVMLILILTPSVKMQKETTNLYFVLSSGLRNANLVSFFFFLGINMFESSL